MNYTSMIDLKMDDEISIGLKLSEISTLIDDYDKKIETLEKSLAERRYSFKYDRHEEYLASTDELRKDLDSLKKRDSYLVDHYKALFDRLSGK